MILVVTARAGLPAALQQLGLRVEVVAPAEALTDLGFAVGTEAVVMGSAPGAFPLLESEAFHTTKLLYAHANATSATVGPVAIHHASPCPSCLAGPVADSPGGHPTMAWLAASLAMELATLHRHGASTLVGTALTWSLGTKPGLVARQLPRRDGCHTHGCVAV